MKDTLVTGTEAREGIIRGIRKCAEAVGGTMGTGGSNAIIEVIENPGQITTNDGATILESIHFVDPLEEMGRKILLEAVKRANKQSGDGSSTTTVLTAAIIEEGLKHLTEASAMEIKRSLEACIPLIEESINKQKREITVDDVGKVATISAEDPEIGTLIQEIYQKIGKSGIIHWDISKTYNDHYTISNGITVDGAGFASPYMADWAPTGEILSHSKMKNPHVIIAKQKISTSADFNNIFSALYQKDIREVVVFCDEFEVPVIPDLLKTRQDKGFKTLLVKMPVLWKDLWYEDLAKVTGATIVDPVLGLSLKDMKIEHVGQVDYITVTKDTTFIEGIKDVTAHVAVLEAEGSDDSLLRASRLNTKTARYYVGAPSDAALSYKRLKVEDAISAAYQALNGGVVLGGGIALIEASTELTNEILKKALHAPYEQITKNMGKRYSKADMEQQEVYDPANVVINAARNAISVAASVLTASVVVQLPRPDIADQLIQAVLSKGMPQ